MARIDGESLHAPHLIDLEVLSVLRRQVLAGDLSAERAAAGITALTQLDLVRYQHATFADRIWALRENLTPYDAAYVALAEALNVPLLTLDGRLARSSRQVHVELF